MKKEIFEKIKEAGSVEELIALAETNGFKLSKEKAEEYFESLNKGGELNDDELDSVSGGKCIKFSLCPHCHEAEPVWLYRDGNLALIRCPKCGAKLTYHDGRYTQYW